MLEKHGEPPIISELRDLKWQAEVIGMGNNSVPPEDGPIPPRYGRIKGRETFTPFNRWLDFRQNDWFCDHPREPVPGWLRYEF